MASNQILKTISKRGSIRKSDLENILALNDSDKQKVVEHLSSKRREQIMALMSNLDEMDDEFQMPISRRISVVSESDMTQKSPKPKQKPMTDFD